MRAADWQFNGGGAGCEYKASDTAIMDLPFALVAISLYQGFSG
jgi:hypothetical protein